ncbi:dnaJ homolog subfamily C member 9-like [Dendronephthya gigantea]|uniref:dnaJ homolog subfamily C member 9-like n=1 Tax=Dendronephthya gigantea TaxID=151771 RepID=UPI00106941BF|nr:dnaJ homolog subfamily C member 9-like [Dendronephthya gigantea]
MSFLEELNSLFGAQGLYEILGVEKDSSEAEIKKAYRRLSLKVHPDRVDSDQKELATKKFQAISKVYSILANKELRAVYDETGEVGEEMVQQERDWMYYWRVLFPKITEEDIKKFEKQYKGSDEELNDLKSAYIRCEGDMEGICEHVMCSTEDDETRFKKILQNAIDNEELPKFDNFTKEDKKKKKARKEKAKKEAAEAEKARMEIGMGSSGDLAAMIAVKQKKRETEMNDFLAGLEEKYSSKNSKKRKTTKPKK